MNAKTKLGLSSEELKQRGAFNTASEIAQQPDVWLKIWDQVNDKKSEILDFLSENKFDRIILTGAGTSAYIGYSVLGTFKKSLCPYTEIISTTDIVSHPTTYLIPDIPTLMISFARSGNSPESVAAMELADKYIGTCHHLVITCNGEGRAALYSAEHSKYTFVLPPETNDKSLVMTSSYSSMLLSALLVASIREGSISQDAVVEIANIGRRVIDQEVSKLRDIGMLDFSRAVFLGAGSLFGTAKEAQLKLQELTDGKIICLHDSFLGFRHGPKSVVDEKTIVFYLFSGDKQALRYEKDLVLSMKKGNKALCEFGVFPYPMEDIDVNQQLVLNDKPFVYNEELMCVPFIVVVQIFSLYKSLQLDLSPDNPSTTGAISRVVEGVIIYE